MTTVLDRLRDALAVAVFGVLVVACGDDTSTQTSGGSQGESTTTGASASESPSSETTTVSGSSAPSTSDGGSLDAATADGESSDGPASSSGADTESSDPYSECAAATSEAECESVVIDWTMQFNNPSCQWRDVYTVQLAEDQCTLVSEEQRCILFHGYLQGCGGGVACPGHDENFYRDLGATQEVSFYPYDDICGPLPDEPSDGANWVKCGKHPVCTCICDVI